MSFKLKSISENKCLFLRLIDPEYMQVKIEGQNASIFHKVFLYTDIDSLKDFFNEMADNWKGWKSERKWSSIEGDILIIATCSLTGTINLSIKLVHNLGCDDWWEFQTIFVVESGQLEDLAKQMSIL